MNTPTSYWTLTISTTTSIIPTFINLTPLTHLDLLCTNTKILHSLQNNSKLETELSKHIWHLKQNKTDFTIKWSIIKRSISYTGGYKRCNLCLEEKLNILKEKDNCLLNKRSEIISACQHKNRFQVKSLNKERNARYFNDNTPNVSSLSIKTAHMFSKLFTT